MQANFYWVQGQEFQETFCIPSEGIQYRDSSVPRVRHR